MCLKHRPVTLLDNINKLVNRNRRYEFRVCQETETYIAYISHFASHIREGCKTNLARSVKIKNSKNEKLQKKIEKRGTP